MPVGRPMSEDILGRIAWGVWGCTTSPRKRLCLPPFCFLLVLCPPLVTAATVLCWQWRLSFFGPKTSISLARPGFQCWVGDGEDQLSGQIKQLLSSPSSYIDSHCWIIQVLSCQPISWIPPSVIYIHFLRFVFRRTLTNTMNYHFQQHWMTYFLIQTILLTFQSYPQIASGAGRISVQHISL